MSALRARRRRAGSGRARGDRAQAAAPPPLAAALAALAADDADRNFGARQPARSPAARPRAARRLPHCHRRPVLDHERHRRRRAPRLRCARGRRHARPPHSTSAPPSARPRSMAPPRRPIVPGSGGTLVVHHNAPFLPHALWALGRARVRGRRVIGYWAWEFPRVPDSWRLSLRYLHEVWVPSELAPASPSLPRPICRCTSCRIRCRR